MDTRVLLKVLGGLCAVIGAVLLVPTAYSYSYHGPHTNIFLFASSLSIIVGTIMFLSQRSHSRDINHRTGFAAVAFSWISACLIGALPYYWSGITPHFVDAVFESTSGFSGTGASVIANIEATDRAVVLWRSMTQWLGGMGIIVFFIAILPILGLGGVQLFRAEITGPQKDKITPRVRETAKKLWLLYVGFTLTLIFLLREVGGLSTFDAVNHGLTTLATGGFSTKNAGVAGLQSIAAEYLLIAFMLLASVNFSLHYRLIALRDYAVARDTELKWYFGVIVIAALLVTFSVYQAAYPTFSESLRHALFITVATASSTGFSNADYTAWPYLTHTIIILLMVMGGMSGSTAGGVKCVRVVAAIKQLNKELKRIVHPSAVLTVKTNKRSVPEHIVNTIWGFLFLYITIFAFTTLSITAYGIDLTTAASSVFSALSNIGPALGDLGPTETYAGLPYGVKALLAFCMLLGRLEFYTVFVILTPMYWRR